MAPTSRTAARDEYDTTSSSAMRATRAPRAHNAFCSPQGKNPIGWLALCCSDGAWHHRLSSGCGGSVLDQRLEESGKEGRARTDSLRIVSVVEEGSSGGKRARLRRALVKFCVFI